MTTWNEKLATGHPAIDAEHQEFIRQLDVLKSAIDNGAGREKTVELIVILQQYVLGHFRREEAYMMQVKCPATANNCTAHREFEQRMEKWLELLTFSGTPVSLVLEVHRETIAWIEGHIMHVDCRLKGCALKDAPDSSTASNPPSRTSAMDSGAAEPVG